MPRDADRIERVLTCAGHALRALRASDSPGALSGDLAAIWRHRLGPTERAFLLAVSVKAAEAEDLLTLNETINGVLTTPLDGLTAEDQSARWVNFLQQRSERMFREAAHGQA